MLDDLAGFGIDGFRSFGSSEIERVGPMGHVHLVVGKNNVGKSNVLQTAQRVLVELRKGTSQSLFAEPDDTPDGWTRTRVRRASVGLYLTEAVMERLRFKEDAFAKSFSTFQILAETEAFSHGHAGTIWFDYDIGVPAEIGTTLNWTPSESQLESALALNNDGQLSEALRQLSTDLTHNSGAEYYNYSQIMTRLLPLEFIPEIEWVEAKRTIGGSQVVRQGENTSGPESFRHGRGLFMRLESMERPEKANLADKKNWARLVRFVRNVLEDPQANVSVSGSGSDLMVETKGREDSYTNLGTGIGEIVHIGAATAAVTGHLICIEEPELHLHPTLQRKMLQYFSEDADNRYLISTHSAALLDSELASISHVTLSDDGWSQIGSVQARRDHARAVSDLGNRRSDFFQSNFLIWVEGPSDRIYVKYWLHLVAPELIEGSHFSIMFYGGALLSHLSFEDAEVQDLIELAQINRSLAIVIDSDKKAVEDGLNDTKARVLQELAKAGALGWVTSGYTIENYVPTEVLVTALKAAYPNQTYVLPTDTFTSPLGSPFEGSNYKPSKVTIARAVCNLELPLAVWPDELITIVDSLKKAIKEANGIA